MGKLCGDFPGCDALTLGFYHESLTFPHFRICIPAWIMYFYKNVEDILSNGEIIREYPDDKPFPSFLLLGYEGERPIHVLAARDSETCYVITVYEPDPEIWQKDFKIKKL
jgi:hypothetical protein